MWWPKFSTSFTMDRKLVSWPYLRQLDNRDNFHLLIQKMVRYYRLHSSEIRYVSSINFFFVAAKIILFII